MTLYTCGIIFKTLMTASGIFVGGRGGADEDDDSDNRNDNIVNSEDLKNDGDSDNSLTRDRRGVQ